MDGKARQVAIIIILLASICYVEIFSKELFIIVPTSQFCKILDPKIVYNVTCKSKNVNRTMNFGSQEIIYRPGIKLTNLYLYRKFATIYRQFMIDIVLDACSLYAGNVSAMSKVMNIERRRQYGNLFDPCPISGRRYENNIPFDYSAFPEIVPAGEYRLDFTSYSILNGTKRELILTRKLGEAKTTTAEYWKK